MTTNRFGIIYFDSWQHPDGLALLQQQQAIDLTASTSDAAADQVAVMLGQAHGYQIRSARNEVPAPLRADHGFLERNPRLLAVATNGAGYDTVDLDACSAAGVAVVNQAGGNREAVAEHALAMMLSLSKRIGESDRALRRDRNWHRNEFIGHDIHGKVIGIIGLGHIGTRVAELCRGLFAMRVLASDPYLSEDQFAQRGARSGSLETVLAESDFVSVHCPRTKETEGLLGADAFARMKPGAFFLNTARGGIHDEQALHQALITGHLAGAGVDVWAQEPPVMEHPLLALDNVIASPHTAGVTFEGRRRVSLLAAEQWIDIARGRRPANLLNPEAWPSFERRYADAMGA